MSDVTDVPAKGAHHAKNALSKVPKWGWAVGGVAVVGFVYYKKKTAAAQVTTSPDANSTAAADQGSTNQSVSDPYAGYSGMGSNAGGGGYGGGTDGSVSPATGSATGSTELADFGTLLGTLGSAGLIANPAALNAQALSTTTPGTSPAPAAGPAPGVVTAVPATAPSPTAIKKGTPATVGTVTSRGKILGISKNAKGQTCHHYAHSTECF